MILSVLRRWLPLLLGLGTLPLLAQDATPVPTPEVTAEPPHITIWLPDALVGLESSNAQAELRRQIDLFTATMPGVTVDLRLKKVSDLGGIMSSLRSASSVAPGALPDLTLLRRQDVVTAARDGLIQSLENRVPSAFLVGLDNGLKLGQVNNQLYGIPYMLEFQQAVYRLSAADSQPLTGTYADILERGVPLAFPAGRVGTLSDVLYVQYLAAGGTLAGDGTLNLNPDALHSVLSFYETARRQSLVEASVINFPDASAYLPAFVDGQLDAAILPSTTYFQLRQSEPGLRAAGIPAENPGRSLMNGWMWVLVTSSPDEQAAALGLLDVLLRVEQQTALGQIVHMLPANRQALAGSLVARRDLELYTSLLENATLPLIDGDGGPLARALQEAFIAVVNGERSADEAVAALQNPPE